MPVGGLTVVSLVLLLQSAAAVTWTAQQLYDVDDCTGTPTVASLSTVSDCVNDQCTTVQVNSSTFFVSLDCNVSDRFAYADQTYGEFNYIVVEDYQKDKCEDLILTTVLPATGSCAISSLYSTYSIIAVLFANGSAVVALYNGKTCGGDPYIQISLDSGEISSGECTRDRYKIYTSASLPNSTVDTNSSSEGSTNTSDSSSYGYDSIAIVCIILFATAVGVMLAIFAWNRRRPSHKLVGSNSSEHVDYDNYSSPGNAHKSTIFSTGSHPSSSSYELEGRVERSISYFWDDEELAAVRVDRDKIAIGELISTGASGQVLVGTFNKRRVAVKMLLPEHRKNVKHLNAFLEEVKLMSRLEHPRIVKFIGAAWDSFADLCVLTEFMRGGDLRSLLASYEANNAPVGFNETKVTIALNVADALTYLHSLDPPVLHRDLKSRNILLSRNMKAKVTDFGISREHAEYTLTAAVGTSLWMAPEVLLGERYDDKADVFSLGVVLSELDLHSLPYSHVKDNNNPGRKMPSAMVANLVASGKLQVNFSATKPNAITELGLACVAVDPKDRPTAAQALYKLHVILTGFRRSSSTDVSVGYL